MMMDVTTESIIRAVDTALYRAKGKGRDRVETAVLEDFINDPVSV
jgi:PleD family two-component response regulator